MFRRDNKKKQQTFADQSAAMRSVPQEHILLRMKRAVEWEEVDEALAPYYERWVGRPGYPPSVLVRMLIIEQWGDLSDREAHEQVSYNLLYRSFVGLGADEPVPDDTTLVVFRQRIGEEGVRKVFSLLNRRWEEGSAAPAGVSF